ncbi:MAG: hypothetical protein A2173_02650 [Planctomycetes bacterium RBG_13_44_8b]|nr:MAG: hypothetical protein A2173_02650 [Planctomycetes bacterium RBG_13_44_8b]
MIFCQRQKINASIYKAKLARFYRNLTKKNVLKMRKCLSNKGKIFLFFSKRASFYLRAFRQITDKKPPKILFFQKNRGFIVITAPCRVEVITQISTLYFAFPLFPTIITQVSLKKIETNKNVKFKV